MNEVKELVDHLRAARKVIVNKLMALDADTRALKNDLSAIDIMLSKQNQEDAKIKIYHQGSINFLETIKTYQPIDAIRKIFKANPRKAWKPGELRDELQIMREQGSLSSKAKDLLFLTHSCLKSLIKNGEIIKDSNPDIPVYYLRKEEENLI